MRNDAYNNSPVLYLEHTPGTIHLIIDSNLIQARTNNFIETGSDVLSSRNRFEIFDIVVILIEILYLVRPLVF